MFVICLRRRQLDDVAYCTAVRHERESNDEGSINRAVGLGLHGAAGGGRRAHRRGGRHALQRAGREVRAGAAEARAHRYA